MQVLGATEVRIEYSRPLARGRILWGDTVPYGSLWRTGANAAPRIWFSRDVRVNGHLLPAGGYALFASDAALVAGWLHYLAFDLFIGAWIVRDGTARAVHPLLILPCLPLAFLFGPTGLLLYLLVRLPFRAGQPETAR